MGKRDELIEGLIQDALDVLHHDRDDDGEIAEHERACLRKRFAARLAPPSPEKEGAGPVVSRADGAGS